MCDWYGDLRVHHVCIMCTYVCFYVHSHVLVSTLQPYVFRYALRVREHGCRMWTCVFADLRVHVYGFLSPTGQDLGTHKQGQPGYKMAGSSGNDRVTEKVERVCWAGK